MLLVASDFGLEMLGELNLSTIIQNLSTKG